MDTSLVAQMASAPSQVELVVGCIEGTLSYHQLELVQVRNVVLLSFHDRLFLASRAL